MDNIESVIIQCFDPTLPPKKKTELGIFDICNKKKIFICIYIIITT